MKASIIFYMLLGITITFPNEVTPLPQEQPLALQVEVYGAECECADGTECGGTCSCSCVPGTCIADSNDLFPAEESDLDGWSHCDCVDGSTCQGKKSCHCDDVTGSCVAFNDCGPTSSFPFTTPEYPDTSTPEYPDTSTPEYPDTSTPDDPDPDTTTTLFSCEDCLTDGCCIWPPPTTYCKGCWSNFCCDPDDGLTS